MPKRHNERETLGKEYQCLCWQGKESELPDHEITSKFTPNLPCLSASGVKWKSNNII